MVKPGNVHDPKVTRIKNPVACHREKLQMKVQNCCLQPNFYFISYLCLHISMRFQILIKYSFNLDSVLI